MTTLTKKVSAVTITRTYFCEKCFRSLRPRPTNKFILYGGSSKKIKSGTVENLGFYGHVPTIFKFISVTEGVITAKRVCGMVDCGDTINGRINQDKWENIKMSVSAWETLVNNTEIFGEDYKV